MRIQGAPVNAAVRFPAAPFIALAWSKKAKQIPIQYCGGQLFPCRVNVKFLVGNDMRPAW